MPPVLGAPREASYSAGAWFVRTPIELSCYVNSSVTSVRSPIRSIRSTTRSSGWGGHERVLLEPVLCGEAAHLRRDERKHGLHGVEAEVPSLRDTHAARLGDLEVVAHLEPADGASLDALHRDADVVQRHLGHAADHSSGRSLV